VEGIRRADRDVGGPGAPEVALACQGGSGPVERDGTGDLHASPVEVAEIDIATAASEHDVGRARVSEAREGRADRQVGDTVAVEVGEA
jgi:hypothetical protein